MPLCDIPNVDHSQRTCFTILLFAHHHPHHLFLSTALTLKTFLPPAVFPQQSTRTFRSQNISIKISSSSSQTNNNDIYNTGPGATTLIPSIPLTFTSYNSPPRTKQQQQPAAHAHASQHHDYGGFIYDAELADTALSISLLRQHLMCTRVAALGTRM
jgi:hypothetical protein